MKIGHEFFDKETLDIAIKNDILVPFNKTVICEKIKFHKLGFYETKDKTKTNKYGITMYFDDGTCYLVRFNSDSDEEMIRKNAEKVVGQKVSGVIYYICDPNCVDYSFHPYYDIWREERNIMGKEKMDPGMIERMLDFYYEPELILKETINEGELLSLLL